MHIFTFPLNQRFKGLFIKRTLTKVEISTFVRVYF